MFKIVCLVKFTPDIQNFVYDYEKNILVRENVDLVLNPDDARSLAFALKMKEKFPETHIRLVTMGPESVKDLVRDLLRRGIDEATILSDKLYAGSDTFVTSSVLGGYLGGINYDLILTGTHTLDGDTAHVPSQVADILELEQMTGITGFNLSECSPKQISFNIVSENRTYKYKISLPSLLGVSDECKIKLPFVRYDDLEKDVDHQITVLSNEDINISPDKLGLKGSPTRVTETHTRKLEKKEQVVVSVDKEGIEVVYNYLKEMGVI